MARASKREGMVNITIALPIELLDKIDDLVEQEKACSDMRE